MHLLPCPNCQASISVSPKQAGNQATCPQCQASVAIPKLGQLRRLPLAEEAPAADPKSAPEQIESSLLRRAGFVCLGLVATASLLVAGFCGIRWGLVEVPSTTEQHIARYRAEYAKLTAAELIREYEDMEKYGLDLTVPYRYKQAELEKKEWGRNASIAAAVGGAAVLGAFLLVATGRRNRS